MIWESWRRMIAGMRGTGRGECIYIKILSVAISLAAENNWRWQGAESTLATRRCTVAHISGVVLVSSKTVVINAGDMPGFDLERSANRGRLHDGFTSDKKAAEVYGPS